MVRDDGSRSLTAFISVIEWPRIPAVYLKDLGNIKILDFKKPNSTESAFYLRKIIADYIFLEI